AFYRWTGGTLILLVLAREYLRKDWPVIKRHIPMLTLLAALGISGFNTLAYIGLHATTAVNGLLMQSAVPMVTLSFSFLLLGQRVSIAQSVGVLISLAGVDTIATRGQLQELIALELNI